jgi:hypothetical protein
VIPIPNRSVVVLCLVASKVKPTDAAIDRGVGIFLAVQLQVLPHADDSQKMGAEFVLCGFW